MATTRKKPQPKRSRKAAPKPPAKNAGKPIHECLCFTATGKREHDCFTSAEPEEASALALLGAACAPWEGPEHIVQGTLQQIQHELEALAGFDYDGENFSAEDFRWLLAGMAQRCRVALEVAGRIEHLPVEQQIANAGGAS